MNFEKLSGTSRVWIFLSSRELTDREVAEIKEKGEIFIGSWMSHDKNVPGAFEIFYNRFLVFFADESHHTVSGCAVDKSVHFIRLLEHEYSITLLDRNIIAYRDQGEIIVVELEKFKNLVNTDNFITLQFFDTHVTTKSELLTRFEIPLSESWIVKLLNLPEHESV